MKFKFKFPTAYSVLLIILVIAAALTYIVPSGKYARLIYDKGSDTLVQTMPDGSVHNLPPTEATLEALGVKLKISAFTDGTVSKPIAIPNTYEHIKASPQGFIETAQAPIKGLYDTVDVIVFILIIGGFLGIFNRLNVFNAGISALRKVVAGKEFIIIIFLTIIVAAGGSTFGMQEEALAFYPLLIPIFMALGYDAITCIAVIFLGCSIGNMFSTINPFSSIIASNIAGIKFTDGITGRFVGLVIAELISMIYIMRYAYRVKKDPTKSIIYAQRKEIEARFSMKDDEGLVFTGRMKVILVIFIITFGIMIWGVSAHSWWFTDMSTLFFVGSIVIWLFSGLSEKECVMSFLTGAQEILSAAFIVGVARSINLVLDDGHISDTILYYGSDMVSHMSNVGFVVFIYLAYVVLGIFIPSSSGLAVLSMPIIAPLADSVGMSRDIIVSAYQFGQGIMGLVTPTGMILVILMMVDVSYDKWLKFVWPLLLMVFLVGFGVLLGQAYL